MKKLAACILMLCLLCGGAWASGVSYQGGAEDFVFLPGSSGSDSDLFENFKGMLPGDQISQKITVKNDTQARVRLYLRAETDGMRDAEFLKQLHMTVTCRDKDIFDAAPDQTAGLTQNTLLGTFRKKGSTDLTVTLSVPVTLNNDFMNREGVVPWTFLAEEIPESGTPDTGDWFRMHIWTGIASALAAAIVVLLAVQRRRDGEEG